MHHQHLILILLLNPMLSPAGADPPSAPSHGRVDDLDIDRQRIPVHLKLVPDKVIWQADEPATGMVVFTNQTQQPVELLYGGIGGAVGFTSHAASASVDASGKRVIKCKSESSTAELSCEARLIKIGKLPGEDDDTENDANNETVTEIEIVEQLIEETEQVPNQITIGPGQSARFPVLLDNYLDWIALPDGSTARLPGRYELKLHYKSTGRLLWQGEVTSQPVEFEVSAS